MVPSLSMTFIAIFIGCVIQIVGLLAGKRNKKLGMIVEITLAILTICYIFYEHSFINGIIYIAFMSSSYFSMITITSGHLKYEEIQEEFQHHHCRRNRIAERYKTNHD